MSSVVDKIIYNTLIKEGAVTLPELGTIRLQGEPRVVLFEETIAPEAPILTDVLIREGGISAEEAATLYDDWRTSSREADGSINIEGVGRIPARTIVMDGAFDKALNHSHDPLPTAHLRKRRKDTWFWWVLAIAIAIFVVAWSLLPWDINSIRIDIWNEEPAEEESVVMLPEVEPFEEVVVEVLVSPNDAASAEEEEATTVAAEEQHPEEQTATTTSTPSTNKRYNLSVGVYSTKQNAQDCIRRDPLGIGSQNYLIGNYPGGKWVVMAHSTNSWAEADNLRAKYRRQGKEVWIYQRY